MLESWGGFEECSSISENKWRPHPTGLSSYECQCLGEGSVRTNRLVGRFIAARLTAPQARVGGRLRPDLHSPRTDTFLKLVKGTCVL